MSDEVSSVRRFGARKVATAALADLAAARNEIATLNDQLASRVADVARLDAEMKRLGHFDVAELEQRRTELRKQIKADQVAARDEAETQRRATRETSERAQRQARDDLAVADGKRQQLEQQIVALKRQVVELSEDSDLQEVGIYRVRHRLADSVAYRSEIDVLQRRIKSDARANGSAVTGNANWAVDGSQAKGRTMVRELSKLMLRAYNGEADVLVKSMKPHKLDSAVERLNKAHAAIERLGRTMQIRISREYHGLRLRELELTADYINQLAAEKEAEREEKARLREERKAQQEMEKERQRLEKERSHYINALEKLRARGDVDGAVRIEERLTDIDRAIEDVDYRAANIRAGYVYVISNVGSFGEQMIKVGMTRRLDPIDRVRELSDASVPFNFDVHALFFSDDAVGIEQRMHQRLADRRVNQVNLRREFFYATPSQARDLLSSLTGELLEFNESPEAAEFRQSGRRPAGSG